MIFKSLFESAQKGELILVDGGMCRFHLRRDGQLTIYEIISMKKGAGSLMLSQLEKLDAQRVVAKCPAQLESNVWYYKRGFHVLKMERTKSGRNLLVWCKKIA